VPRLNLILSDCYSAPISEPRSVALPRLPGLEFCLSRAAIEHVPAGWQHWLAWRLGGAALAATAPGGIAAAGYYASPDTRHYWLATPVNYVVGIDSMRLHPAGLLRLTPGEQQQLTADFARVFAGSGWELLATGQRDLLLAGPAQAAASSLDPARVLGKDPSAAVAFGSDGTALRRLGSECEMWLHDHAINRARAAARTLTVSGLWFWGGGAIAAAVPGRASLCIADDTFVTGAARLTGATLASMPDAWTQVVCGAQHDECTVVCQVAGEAAASDLQRIERHWLGPMLSQWRAGRWSDLTVVAGELVAVMTPASRWRWWRRVRPWWEILSAC